MERVHQAHEKFALHPALPIFMTYFITFSCYGSHLHGDEGGSIDRNHNQPGGPARPSERALRQFEQREMTQSPYLLAERRRTIVLTAIIWGCERRRWELFAAHVRENHVHIVVEAFCLREKVAQACKAYASRFLNEAALDAPGRKRWTRHASMKRLHDGKAREEAIRYVAANQGVPMALFVAPLK